MTPPPVVPAGNGQQDGQSLDELVMGTNSSSIVSKRSVEKLYYPDEPHFYRFFVPRFQRRAPLVNRGYHLRIKVIDTIVRNFLREPTSRKKVIVNLGCGSDVLPWQCHARYPELAGDTIPEQPMKSSAGPARSVLLSSVYLSSCSQMARSILLQRR
ncbi:tRNA wybutosine-synthesizing protein 4 like [Verticillium longisporum]|uniref:tRNA wybutosine-synthesizing protein 4 like n=1 Tax=Verticillium longisporum TaxID=100787 RepID=A0A8I2ZGP4_VERLO|nr:tRNA wybutosine-synthesizing protein 4 like [Verticillium longisporum]